MSRQGRVRVGLIGCGVFGESHLEAYSGLPFVEVVAVADAVEERARKLASRHGVPHVASGIRELCSLKDLDAVSVVTTEDQHLEPVLTAIKHGKHVLVEKPMATKTEDACKMVEAAQKAGVILMPGHILRFETRYAAVKERLDKGGLGRVVYLYARRNRPKWQGKIYKRGPIILETAIHDIDAMLWYANAKVDSVYCCDVKLEPQAEADLTCAVLKFSGGAVGFLQTSWLLPDKTAFLDDALQVIATAGLANVDVLHSGLSIWREEGVEYPDVSYEPRLRGAAFGALREELNYFAMCVLEGRQPTVVTAQDGVEAVRVAGALVESGRAAREIRVSSG